MADKKLKIIGITVSITVLMFIALAIFIKSIGILFNGWFTQNALVISIISGIFVVFGIITGAISIGAMTSKGRGMFS
ncbi:MAG: hypothetical protein KKF56_05695 [Nanoarchaeota archaeon]|nr:hypothetical protein [Nanoarchaeota archaeon]